MTDIVDTATRSRMMAGIGPANTGPEMCVRSYLHGTGLRFRLHLRGLPGSPDIVLPAYRSVVFVNGCFWHRHPKCCFATSPSTRRAFWQAKFAANVARDRRQQSALRKAGWHVFVVWGCEAADEVRLDRLSWRIRAVNE